MYRSLLVAERARRATSQGFLTPLLSPRKTLNRRPVLAVWEKALFGRPPLPLPAATARPASASPLPSDARGRHDNSLRHEPPGTRP
jgi:hypothetical protein